MRDAAIVETEIRHFEQQLERFEAGALEPELFKKLRLQHGIYGLRGSSSRHMVRVRLRLGIVTAEQLEALAEVCAVETSTRACPAPSATPPASQPADSRPGRGGACHVTTRQDVQLYGIERRRLPTLLRQLARADLTTREASGNVVRNVTCCPFAGVSPEESFDITPYALAVSDYLLRNPLTQLLPRKVKVAFEGCRTDHARTAIHDLGIVGAMQEGRIGFRVYVGGGLGAVPRSGRLLEPWTSTEQLLPTIEAILRLFERAGERQVRARARLKFLIEQLSWDEFQRRVLAERPAVWATQSGVALSAFRLLAPHESSPVVATAIGAEQGVGETMARWMATNVTAQKQPDVVSVTVRLPFGDVDATQLHGLARLLRAYAAGARVTNEQNVLLRGVPEAALPSLYDELRRLALAEAGAGRLADVTRCPGAETCLSAITRPRGVAQALEQMMHNGLGPSADAPLSIKLSGCPNSCGHHLIADIGGFGVAVKVGDRHVPCYQLLVGGGTREGEARFGQRLVRVPAQRAPQAIKRLVTFYHEQRQPEERFGAFVDRLGCEPLRQALHEFADVTEASRAPELFVDLGAEEPFVLEAGRGECAE